MPSLFCHVQGHSGAVIALAHILVGDRLLLFSSAEDAQVLVWEYNLASQQGADSAYSQWTLQQKLDAGAGLQHCLAVSHIPGQPDWYALQQGLCQALALLFNAAC